MKKYAKIINEETKACEVGVGTNIQFYQSIGMTEQEVEQAWDGAWYLAGYAPEKPQEVKEQEVRAVRNSYLEQYVDTYQLVIRWNTLTQAEQEDLTNYRQYLLDYTNTENWWEKNPKTFDEWKTLDKTSESDTIE